MSVRPTFFLKTHVCHLDGKDNRDVNPVANSSNQATTIIPNLLTNMAACQGSEIIRKTQEVSRTLHLALGLDPFRMIPST
jgi:hypothetical protein